MAGPFRILVTSPPALLVALHEAHQIAGLTTTQKAVLVAVVTLAGDGWCSRYDRAIRIYASVSFRRQCDAIGELHRLGYLEIVDPHCRHCIPAALVLSVSWDGAEGFA